MGSGKKFGNTYDLKNGKGNDISKKPKEGTTGEELKGLQFSAN